jgi:hypothetical protein
LTAEESARIAGYGSRNCSESQRNTTSGTTDVDWSGWGDEWAEPDTDSKTQKKKEKDSSWNDWNDEQLSPVGTATNGSRKNPPKQNGNASAKKSLSKTKKGEEPNLIDFEFGGESLAGAKDTATKAGDGWDTEVWADVDDDNWETLETDVGKATRKPAGKKAA